MRTKRLVSLVDALRRKPTDHTVTLTLSHDKLSKEMKSALDLALQDELKELAHTMAQQWLYESDEGVDIIKQGHEVLKQHPNLSKYEIETILRKALSEQILDAFMKVRD